MRQDIYERLQQQSRREFGNRRDFDDESFDRNEQKRPQNFRFANSEYDDDRRNDGENRGFLEKAADEVSSWFGGDERENRSNRDRNENEFDGKSDHSYQAGYTPKGASPFYPITNRIYERGNDVRDDYSNRNFQSNRNDYDRARPRKPALMRSENRDFRNSKTQFSNQNSERNRRRDWHDTRAGDLMTRNVSTVHPNDSVQQAARVMRDEDCGALPVVDRHGRMIGMITDRDITVRLVANGDDPRRARVEDCMTDEVFACHADDPIEGCIRSMKQHQVRRMPIVNDRNRLLGIISQGDLARYADLNKRQGQRHAFTGLVSEISEPSNKAYR